jgi:hypothetical protein
MRVLRHAHRYRPKPWCVSVGRVRPHDPPDLSLAVEHLVIVIVPGAAGAMFRGSFEGEHNLVNR